MITAARVEEIRAALTAAQDAWPQVAKRLPEFGRLSKGIPSGARVHRPYVYLDVEHEDHDSPVYLVQYETGVWFTLGTYTRELETHSGQV